MATRGARPKPTFLRIVGGNAGKRPLPKNDPMPEGPPEKPPGMDGEAGALWNIRIARAHWLTWADSDKAAMWCLLQAEFYAANGDITAARIAQLRALGSELGFDPSSRARIGADASPKEKSKDPSIEFLG